MTLPANKTRILVVEDEAIIASDIRQQLIKLGYEPVGHAVRGEQAIELARELKPDLVLMDIHLAGDMDGITASNTIAKLFGLPVVYLTAFAEDQTFERAMHTDPFGYIVKPFSERELRTTLAIALYKHGVEFQLRKQTLALQDSEERHRQTNARIGHLNHVLRAINEVSSLLNRAQTALKLLTDVCDSLVKTRGYLTVWVGQPEAGSKQVLPVAHSGGDTSFPQHAPITWDDSPSGQGPTGTAIRERRAVVFNDLAHDPRFAPWRDSVVASGSGSIASIPIIHGEQLFGALTIKADRPDAFDEEEVVLLTSLAKDVARTLHNFEAEAARRKAEEALAQSHSLLNATLDSTTDGILVVDVQGKVTSYNQKFLELWRVPPDLAARGEDQPMLHYVMGQLEEQTAFLAKVKQLYDTPGSTSRDELKFRDGRIFERFSKPQRIGDNVVGRVWSFRDVTERRRAETALHESESVLRSIMENSKEVIFVKDRECRFIFMNSAGYRLTGLTPEKLLGRSKADFHPNPAEAAQFMADDRRVMKSGLMETIEENIGAANGTRHVFLTTKIARRDSQGNVIGLIGVAHDITERKRAEIALQQLNREHEMIFNSVVEGIHGLDLQGRITFENAASAKMFGREINEMLGQSAHELIHHSHADGSVFPVEQCQIYATMHDGVIRRVKDEVFWRKDGTSFPVEYITAPKREENGTIVGVVVVFHNLTERMRAEEKLNLQISALTAAANAIMITDRHGIIEWINPAFTKLTGFSAAEAIGKTPRILNAGQHTQEFYGNFWQAILAGEVWQGELVNKRKDGTVFTEDLTVTPVRAADGQISHFVAIIQDVTERRQFENSLRQAQKMEAIGRLAGGIAHDFNNILAAIFGYCHLLQEDAGDNAVVQEDAAEIFKSASRAKDLVQQILTFSRPREQQREIVRLDTVVKEATKFLRASLPAQIQIEMDLAADAPAVRADPTQIYQVTMNLATNALHAMEGKPGELTVTLDSFLPDEKFLQLHSEFRSIQYARLTVADTGLGMDPTTLDRIFEPFFSTKPVGKGTGLGLSVVHGIMKSHEGVIIVESQIGCGTKFHLFFPGQMLVETSAQPATAKVALGQGQKILVVDDEQALTTVLERNLLRLGYQVIATNSARKAIEVFQATPTQFDLILTDLTMPAMTGLELARYIHAVRPELPIVLASGHVPDLSHDQLREAGIWKIIEKPFSMPVLTEALRQIFTQKQL